MAKPREARPAQPPAAASDESEPYDAAEVIQDLGNQNAALTVELAAARSVVRRLRKENTQLKADLVAKSSTTG